MKALLQRVSRAQVDVGDCTVGRIDAGLLVFLALERMDDEHRADAMLHKLLRYRVFADAAGRMNRSVIDVSGGILLIPQFTLAAETTRGLRPSFSSAMPPPAAAKLFEYAVQALRATHPVVAAGEFGADMQISLTNDGPVTFLLELP